MGASISSVRRIVRSAQPDQLVVQLHESADHRVPGELSVIVGDLLQRPVRRPAQVVSGSFRSHPRG
jgi:hypothetical protein